MSTSWHDVAATKLTRVLGPTEGPRVLAETLKAIGLERLETHDDLSRFARQLEARGGFATALAAMLHLHIAMYAPQVSASG